MTDKKISELTEKTTIAPDDLLALVDTEATPDETKKIKLSNLGVGKTDIYSSDFGLNWADLGVIATDGINAIAYLGNGIVVLGDLDYHVWRSTDYGATWTDLGVIASGAIYTMANLGNGIVIMGDYPRHVYRSTDYGATWTDLGVISSGAIYAMAYLGNGIAILGDFAHHVYRSTDYGATWSDLGVITSEIIYAIAYLGNGIAILGDAAYHVHRSTDYGATWSDLGVIASTSIYSMTYIGNGIAILGTESDHVHRSTDYGATWADLGVIALGPIHAMAYLRNGVTVLGDAAFGGGHVHRSADYGATWTDLGAVAAGSIQVIGYLDNGITILGAWDYHIHRSTSAFQTSNFNPNQFDKLFQFGCLGAITANGTSYLAPGNGATQTNEIKVRVPRPGILKNLYVWQRVASGAGGRTDIYTVRVNGVDKTITCTLDNATEGSDTTNEVLVAAGDQASIKLVSNNSSDTSEDVVATLELV